MTKHKQTFNEAEMPIGVEISDGMLRVLLKDGRLIATPLDWYPAFRDATMEQLNNVELGASGIYWPDLDEDLSVAGMLRGNRAPESKKKTQSES
jgi:hypothetical protein